MVVEHMRGKKGTDGGGREGEEREGRREEIKKEDRCSCILCCTTHTHTRRGDSRERLHFAQQL